MPQPFLALITPLTSDGRPDQGLPVPPVGIWPSPGHPSHPIAPGGRPPLGIWGPTDPRPSNPIALPPGSISGTPEQPIYTPPLFPSHPIELPPGSVGGTPEQPIYYPPYPDQGLPGGGWGGRPPRPDQGLPWPGRPVDPGWGVGLPGGRPIDPGWGIPEGGVVSPPIYIPGVPPHAPGSPSHPIYITGEPSNPIYIPGYPTHPIAPGGRPGRPVDPGWGINIDRPDQGLPVPPEVWPIPPAPLPPDLESQIVVAVHRPGQGWVVKKYPVGPDQGLPGGGVAQPKA